MNARHALTLLELLVAIVVMVAVVALTGALWAQTAQWTGDEARHRRALRLDHARDLFHAQWAARPADIPLDGPDGPDFRISDDRFEFVTAAPRLFPGAALARAAYIREPIDAAAGEPARWRLRYREHRALRPDFIERRDFDDAGAPAADEVVLLDDCPDLRIERLAPLPPDDPFGGDEPRTVRHLWAAPGAALSAAADDPARFGPTRTLLPDEPAPADPIGARITGVFQETSFAWTVPLEPSR